MTTHIGMCFPRTYAAGLVKEVAKRLDAGGADQIWIIEDCFYTAGISLAATAAAVSERLTVGLGILPAVVRNPAITAMELATLSALAPGRVLPGLGHGVQSWMGQIGARPRSPLTSLDEVVSTVRRLLAGEQVTFDGDYVHLDDVQLDQPPADPPPLLAGVQGPKSITLAGHIADGLILSEPATPSYVRWALDQAGRTPDDFHIATFSVMCILADRAEAYRIMAPRLASMLERPPVGLTVVPFFEELQALHAAKGTDGLATMPADWWAEIGPIGTLDDAADHIAALRSAGGRSVGLFPAPDPKIGMREIDDVLALAAGRS